MLQCSSLLGTASATGTPRSPGPTTAEHPPHRSRPKARRESRRACSSVRRASWAIQPSQCLKSGASSARQCACVVDEGVKNAGFSRMVGHNFARSRCTDASLARRHVWNEHVVECDGISTGLTAGSCSLFLATVLDSCQVGEMRFLQPLPLNGATEASTL